MPIARSKAPRRPPLPYLRRRRGLRSRLRALVFRLTARHPGHVRPRTS